MSDEDDPNTVHDRSASRAPGVTREDRPSSMDRVAAGLRECLSKAEILNLLHDVMLGLFDAARARVFRLADMPAAEGLPPWRDNPLTRLFLQEESALHEALIMDNATWRMYCPRADHGHVLVGPLVSGGAMVGVVAVTREEGERAFDAADLRTMNRLALYASTRLAEVGEDDPWDGRLSAREVDVALCVRGGLRNAEIARKLVLSEHTVKQNLKSIFRKLGVRSRTELALQGGT